MTAPGDDDRDGEPAARLTIWQRLERPARGPRPALTHEQIAEAAIEIADAEGLDAVSMRRLADRLGVATMALYRYVAEKNDVFELMVDLVHAEVALDTETGWRALARAYAVQTRVLVLRHPWVIELLARTPVALTPRLVGLAEKALVSVDGLGLDVDSMMAIFATVTAYVRGATSGEVAEREAARRQGWVSDDDVRLAYLPYVRWLIESGRYPTLTRYIIEGSNEDDAEWRFDFGLECVLEGIAARLGI
jgi:AcrR family transcriptional regulator